MYWISLHWAALDRIALFLLAVGLLFAGTKVERERETRRCCSVGKSLPRSPLSGCTLLALTACVGRPRENWELHNVGYGNTLASSGFPCISTTSINSYLSPACLLPISCIEFACPACFRADTSFTISTQIASLYFCLAADSRGLRRVNEARFLVSRLNLTFKLTCSCKTCISAPSSNHLQLLMWTAADLRLPNVTQPRKDRTQTTEFLLLPFCIFPFSCLLIYSR
jgi:hypothetical protein